MVSVKIEIVIQEWRKHLLLFALLIQLSFRCQICNGNHNNTTCFQFFIKMKMVIFVFVVVVTACACFVVARDSVSRSSALLVQRVLRQWCVVQVSCGYILFIVLHKFFIVFCFDIDVLVPGDLRHEYAQSAWGFLFRGPPGCWLRSSRLSCSDWCSFDDDCRHGMNVFMTPLLRLLARPPSGSKAYHHGSPPRVRGMLILGTSQWWRGLHPLQSVMASIVPIVLAMALLPVVACRNCA